MAMIIRLRGDSHQQTQELLPWYANSTLDAREAQAVEAHLADCEECRADLEQERALVQKITEPPADVDRGWAALLARVEAAEWAPAAARPLAAPRLLRRRVPLGWAVGAQAAALLLTVGITYQAMRGSDAAPYHALGSAPIATPGNILVVFRPDTSEYAMRSALIANGARVVDGPTVSGAYVLNVAGPARGGVVARLRKDGHVMLAQPIDAGVAP
jgi:hypothetical protein